VIPISIRAAVASTDRVVINEHFGRADRFHIYELSENGFKFIETRFTDKCCQGGEHTDSAFDRTAEVLSDCKAIFTARIGSGAAAYMESKGFEIFESPNYINDVLQKVIDEKILTV
jgi:predicted Fe-Mo cluster-binding NifX family protein